MPDAGGHDVLALGQAGEDRLDVLVSGALRENFGEFAKDRPLVAGTALEENSFGGEMVEQHGQHFVGGTRRRGMMTLQARRGNLGFSAGDATDPGSPAPEAPGAPAAGRPGRSAHPGEG